ncbi:glycerate kinase [Saccharicrinis carchari]|uniref:Glycerate kinase n=1 Tax=Saccharicrinis carchari TaxID=1168039 RepID=A0A521DU68_SACCC|nr:glycerate kinase [Saccharicrinis carchari]SMO75247.1 glycerate kinase [Saccharicrinis carchari]
MQKILIAPDSFKGCLSSSEVAIAIQQGVLEVFPQCQTVKIPVADGGEGTCDTLVTALGGKKVELTVHDPLMRPIRAVYGILNDGYTAVIELAAAAGLTLLHPSELNPMQTSTYGVGEMIKHALLRGCSKFLIGIGGSATNDAGIGVLRALGYEFLNRRGEGVSEGGQSLAAITAIDDSKAMPQLKDAFFSVACDVNNPFSGFNGAAHVYASQKGANIKMIEQLDEGMEIFRQLLLQQKQIDLNNIPGAGAAGGMGGALVAFLNANLKPGIQVVLEALNFDAHLNGADLVITGEGKLDYQTTMGKAPSGILKMALQRNVPVIAIGGSIEDPEHLNKSGFLSVYTITQGPVTMEEAMDKEGAQKNIRSIIIQLMRSFKYFS